MAEAKCHYCTRPAEAECHSCGRLFCGEHGEDVCLRCLSPEAATPSPLVFRGAIVTLAVASALAIYLVVSPPASKSSVASPQDLRTPVQSLPATATPTPPGQGPTRSVTATPIRSATPVVASVTPGGPTVTPAGGPQTYTVVPGDSISVIASRLGFTEAEIRAANPGISDTLQIGQLINLPRR